MDMRKALVLGATGGIGGEMARVLQARGYAVTAMTRDRARAGSRDGISWQVGDALVAADVARAAEGAGVIVHAVNPPGYRDWDKVVLPMLDNTIAAASRHRARVVLPGTVYNFGPDAWRAGAIGEDAPQNPVTRKGKIRVEMERRLRAAAEMDAIKVLIVRAGDYFGPGKGNGWFGQIAKPGRRPRALTRLGTAGVGHQWAFLPDVAETMARLLDRPDLPAFARYHMDGHWDPDGTAMLDAIRRVLAAPELPARGFPWPLVRLASPLVPLFREILEMRYLWRDPVRLDNTALVATLDEEPRTPLDEAVAVALRSMGCLEAA
jgi:nucleoside-diphosphate-sugar epimerase